jgi:peptide/nickel transport system substrate-binding protein
MDAGRELEPRLRGLIDEVRRGQLPRRGFIARMAALGISAPMAGLMLLDAGVAQAQPPPVYKPTKRGGGGALKLLYWQGPTLLNPHFATGTKDSEGSRLFYEPLVYYDSDARPVPVLATEVPSRSNGGIAADGRWTVWKLRRGVTWHDGRPFTADDVVFNWQFASDPAAAAFSLGVYENVKAFEKIDSHTVRVVFEKPTTLTV